MKHLKKFNETKEENIYLKEQIFSSILEIQDYFRDGNYFLSVDTIEDIYDELERTRRGSGTLYQLIKDSRVCIRLRTIRAPKSAKWGLSSKISLDKKVDAEKKWCEILEDLKISIERLGDFDVITLEIEGILWVVIK